MKMENIYANPETYDISVDEFDALNGNHEFSGEYKKNKQIMLKEYKKNVLMAERKGLARIAVAAAFAVILLPVAANAATNGGLFDRIWGTAGRNDVKSHKEVIEAYDGKNITVTYPQVDYEELNPEKAERLIGDNVSTEPIVKKLGDTTLTVLSVVTDGNSAIAELTLEREGGVNALNYSQIDNEAKGAYFSPESDFYFNFYDTGEKIYVDLEKSTPDKLYCYDYIAFSSGNVSNELVLETCYMEQTKKESIKVPFKSEVAKTEYCNSDGGTAQLSPMSLKFDLNTGFGLTKAGERDPINVYYVSVNYKDGTNYVVKENNCPGKHSCEVEINNAGYTCTTLDGEMIYMFNRLVDMDNVESFTVNDTIYTKK